MRGISARRRARSPSSCSSLRPEGCQPEAVAVSSRVGWRTLVAVATDRPQHDRGVIPARERDGTRGVVERDAAVVCTVPAKDVTLEEVGPGSCAVTPTDECKEDRGG